MLYDLTGHTNTLQKLRDFNHNVMALSDDVIRKPLIAIIKQNETLIIFPDESQIRMKYESQNNHGQGGKITTSGKL